MKSQTLFALNGEVRGAARLVHEGESGTLAVEIAGRATGEYEAWLIPRRGAVLRAPLGPTMSAAVPAQAKDAAGVFIASAGRIIASGSNGLTKTDMEAAVLRVQFALANAQKDKPEMQKPPAPKRELRTPQPAQDSPAHPPEQAHTRNPAQEADTAAPPVTSEAARSIVSMANSLFHPTGEAEREFAFVEAPIVRPQGQQGMRQSLSNAQAPMQPAAKHAVQPPYNRRRQGCPPRCPGRR